MINRMLISSIMIFTIHAAADTSSKTKTTVKTTTSNPVATTPNNSTTTATVPSTLTDGQIAQIVMTINEGEVNSAKTASSQAANADVKKFAKMMAEHHRENKMVTERVAREQNIKVAGSDLDKTLRNDAQKAQSDLKANRKAKPEFDRTYIDQQVTLHETALSTLNEVLIPQAQNSALRTHLEKTQESVRTHLDQARNLQTQVGSTTTTTDSSVQ